MTSSINRVRFRVELDTLYSKYPKHITEPVSRQVAEMLTSLQQEIISLECVAAMLAHENYLHNKNS